MRAPSTSQVGLVPSATDTTSWTEPLRRMLWGLDRGVNPQLLADFPEWYGGVGTARGERGRRHEIYVGVLV